MKKFYLLVLLFLLSINSVFAEVDSQARRDAYKLMIKSNTNFHDISMRASKNFRYDNRFANYLRNKCLLYESDRQRFVDSIFPITNNVADWYKDEYQILKTNFIVKMNNREIENQKLIINEYCKYNQYKFEKKDPEACSPQRINAIFKP